MESVQVINYAVTPGERIVAAAALGLIGQECQLEVFAYDVAMQLTAIRMLSVASPLEANKPKQRGALCLIGIKVVASHGGSQASMERNHACRIAL